MPRAFASKVAAGASSSMNAANEELLSILNALRETDLGERATDERARAHEAAMEHGAGAPRDANIPGLEHLERHERGVDQVPQFMGEEPEALASRARTLHRCPTDFVRARIR